MKIEWTKSSIAALIDHTVLKAETSQKQVETICEEAITYSFAAVCVNPTFVEFVSKKLKNSSVKTCTVVGFPLGANTTEIKVKETQIAIGQGAQEIDMVINLDKLKAGNHQFVEKEIKSVVDASEGAIVKVIIEACFLNENEKKMACELSKAAGAHFVKTSTGFGSGGATVADIKLMRQVVGNELKIKASGGIRSFSDAKALIEAGADRIGCSSSIAIINAI